MPDHVADTSGTSKRPWLQFSLRSLLILITITCFAVAWFSRPPRVKISSYLQFSPDAKAAGSRASRDGTIPSSLQSDALSAIKSEPFLRTLAAGPFLSQLDLIKNQPSPVKWLQKHVDAEIIDAGNGSNALFVSLILPESQQEDGMAIVKAVVFEYETQVTDAERMQLKSELPKMEEKIKLLTVQLREHTAAYEQLQKEHGDADSRTLQAKKSLDEVRSKERELWSEMQAMADDLEPPSTVTIVQGVIVQPLGRW